MKVKCNIIKLSKEKGISLSQLSRKADISYPTILRMANNETSSYDVKILAKLCEALDCKLGELLELVPDEEVITGGLLQEIA